MTELTRILCGDCATFHGFRVDASKPTSNGECPCCRMAIDSLAEYADRWAWKYVKINATGEYGRVIGAEYRKFGKCTEYVVAIGLSVFMQDRDRCRVAIGLQLIELLDFQVTPELVRTCHDIETAKRESVANLLLFPPRADSDA